MQLTLNLRLPPFYDGRRNDGQGKSERISAEGGRGEASWRQTCLTTNLTFMGKPNLQIKIWG